MGARCGRPKMRRAGCSGSAWNFGKISIRACGICNSLPWRPSSVVQLAALGSPAALRSGLTGSSAGEPVIEVRHPISERSASRTLRYVRALINVQEPYKTRENMGLDSFQLSTLSERNFRG